MPRPQTKTELVHLADANYQKLAEFIESLSPEDQNGDFPEGTMNRNIADVIFHLHEWHKMMLNWHRIGSLGQKPEMPAKGFTWKSTTLLNQKLWAQNKDRPLAEALQLFAESHLEVFHLIKGHSEEELFTKKKYPWTGSTSLAAYLISATSSHYDWALKLIRKAIKTKQSK